MTKSALEKENSSGGPRRGGERAPDRSSGSTLVFLGALQLFPWLAVFFAIEIDDPLALAAALIGVLVYIIPAVLVWRSVIPAARSGHAPSLGVVVVTGLNLVVGPFAALHWQMSQNVQGCFNTSLTPVDAIYFTLTTLTTTGFGDIRAVAPLCRLAVTAQMIVDAVIFLGVVAVAITHYAAARQTSSS